jgi:hypothetical protein
MATYPSVQLAQRCRNMAQMIHHQLQQMDMKDRQKTGRVVGPIIEDVYVGPDMATVTGDEFAANLAGKLFRQSGLRNVEVYEHCSRPGVWVASGLVR